MIRIAGNYSESESVVGNNGQSRNVVSLVIILIISTVLTVSGHIDGDDVVMAVLHHRVVIVHHPADDRGAGPGLDSLNISTIKE